jgi:putative NIF3 family GTP cyclohydrolase 1 type 2
VLISLTPSVCAEALALPACSAVIAYHPPIFRGLKALTLADPLQASLLKLAARGISVFAPHTSLDATPNGINTW